MESPAISKRKPPSQRPERKLDDLAREVARVREANRPDHSADAPRERPSSSFSPVADRRGSVGIRKQSGGPVPAPSTKQPKHPGS